jgi:plasmid replication initiation protein
MTEKLSEDFIRKKGGVRQSNIITNSPLPFTTLEGRLFVCILAALKKDKLEYSLSVSDLMKMMSLTPNRYGELLTAINGIYDKSIPIPTEDDNITDELRILDRKQFPKISGEKLNGMVNLHISSSVVPYLFDLLSNYTHYDILSFISLKSTNSQKLYTQLAMFKGTQTLIRDFDSLQQIFSTNYKTLYHFKEAVLDKSIKEITQKTNISRVKLEPIKKGRRITGYKFLFRWNQQMELPMNTLESTQLLKKKTTKIQPKKPEDSEMVEKKHQQLMKEYNLTPNQSFTILTHMDLRDINRTLYIIQQNRLNGLIKGEIGSYTLGVFARRNGMIF